MLTLAPRRVLLINTPPQGATEEPAMSKRNTFPRPAGHHVITPMAMVPGAARVIDFLERALGSTLMTKVESPDGHLVHAEVMVGDSVLMLGDPLPGTPAMPAALFVYVDDAAGVDEAYGRALAAGARSTRGPEDENWGYRTAMVTDVGGNQWTIAAIIEEGRPDALEQHPAP